MRAEAGQVRRRDVDRPAPGVGDPPAGELREEAHERPSRVLDQHGVELEHVAPPGAIAHPAAAPAERDAAVRRRPEVVQQRACVRDRLAAGPAELLEHVRHRLGEHEVARRHGERTAEPRKAGGRTVHREHGRSGRDAPAGRLGARAQAEDGGALVDADATLEQAPPKAEGEPCRLHASRSSAAPPRRERRGETQFPGPRRPTARGTRPRAGRRARARPPAPRRRPAPRSSPARAGAQRDTTRPRPRPGTRRRSRRRRRPRRVRLEGPPRRPARSRPGSCIPERADGRPRSARSVLVPQSAASSTTTSAPASARCHALQRPR